VPLKSSHKYQISPTHVDGDELLSNLEKLRGNPMGYSKTLNSLKTVIAVATAFNIATCLVTESAQAKGIGTFSGNAVLSPLTSFTFDIEDVQDQAPNDDSRGVFPGAIQNFNYQRLSVRPETNNSDVCGQEDCPPGTLTVTKFSLDSVDFPGIDLNNNPDRLDLNTLLKQRLFIFSSNVDFSQDVLRYDVNFDNTSPSPELIWFIQSNDSNLINDLSALINVDRNKIVALLATSFPDVTYGGSFTFSNISGQSTSQQVPEPSITHALLCLGVLGTVSLLQRNKRFLKSVTQNSSSLSQKST
jgi:hypothetical protein